MGPRVSAGSRGVPSIVFARASGCNVWDVDGNRFVDLAAGFGSLLLGHSHPVVVRSLAVQSERLLQSMGDLFASDARIALLEQLTARFPAAPHQGILGQSGADAVTAALKTALLYTGKPAVIAVEGAYHGLSYGPLAACGLRGSYRTPFASHLNPHVRWVPFLSSEVELDVLGQALARGDVGALLIEPVLGRGGVRPIAREVLVRAMELAREAGALVIADEIWTGLGRSGEFSYALACGAAPDIVTFGKGLGGGLPVSAAMARAEVMAAWSQEREVVHTSTFAGAPLACATAIATLRALEELELIDRSREIGTYWKRRLVEVLTPLGVEVRGHGLMLAIDFGARPGAASRAMGALLERGFITSTGGGGRDVLVLTPPLIVERALLDAFCDVVAEVAPAVLQASPVAD